MNEISRNLRVIPLGGLERSENLTVFETETDIIVVTAV